MAKRPSKPAASYLSSPTYWLVIAALGIGAVALFSKKADAAPSSGPPAAKQPPASPSKIAIVSQGTSAAASPVPLPAFAVDAGLPVGGAAVFLEAFDASGKPVFSQAGAVEPSIETITKPAFFTHKGDLQALIDDGTFAGYLSQPFYGQILAAGGKVLIWSANPDGSLIKWWLTQWS